ncbi:TIGR04282 family arsenosugar biosynthesis glycosyltransferase [Tenacibaculum sp. SG-28]|uniref:TIGR04282 family arsenosugar biosynthesis glycosyltransferase n=1 Tax=Tenacibaculum sp. SG-28 TaxID=754426 RepID=UPI000CF51A32|nr:TIGR04282 family arsenosugar biosynthesis glycosyltransferase [Tenacibaculum sp. SG-28]PQJ21707.1 glycosyltransferase [Tenacibaculum sp. SG-28]
MAKNLLLIFTRNPKLGRVKTRLAKSIGTVPALHIYQFLLEHTKSITQASTFDKAVYYSEEIEENDIWEPTSYQKYVQIGTHLGARMDIAFKNAFAKGYSKVVVIGSDLLDLQEIHLTEAFEQLNSHDTVIGPAKDGGYYLLGCKNHIPNIFRNKNWGSTSVYEETLKDLEGLSVHLLEPLNDIDVFEDIKDIKLFDKFYK